MVQKPPKKVPVAGDISHNHGFLLAMGGLLVNWANAESIFMAMLQAALGVDKFTAAIVWHSFRGNTKARLDLTLRLCRERTNDTDLIEAIEGACSQFIGFSKVRNFFCHASYSYDAEGKLDFANGAELTHESDPIRFVMKPMDRATANEIIDAATKLAPFSEHCWDLAERIAARIGGPPVERPQHPLRKC